MASGFIKISKEIVSTPRWTGFDEIIRIVIRELMEVENSKKLIEYLNSHIPPENFNPDGLEMGWGFIDERINGTTSRVLELKELSDKNLELFWNAVEIGNQNLEKYGTEYSTLYPKLLKDLLDLKK